MLPVWLGPPCKQGVQQIDPAVQAISQKALPITEVVSDLHPKLQAWHGTVCPAIDSSLWPMVTMACSKNGIG